LLVARLCTAALGDTSTCTEPQLYVRKGHLQEEIQTAVSNIRIYNGMLADDEIARLAQGKG